MSDNIDAMKWIINEIIEEAEATRQQMDTFQNGTVVIGLPQATHVYSTEQLVEMDLIGLWYVPNEY